MKPPTGLLLQAVKANNLMRAKKLLEQGADPNEEDPETGGTVLHAAVFSDETGLMAKLLLEHNANVNALTEGRVTPVMYAARSNTKALRFLLEKNPDLAIKDFMNRDALVWAKNALNPSSVTLIQNALNQQALAAEQKKIDEFHQMAERSQDALRKRRVHTVLRGPR